jgi:hypothetical protein
MQDKIPYFGSVLMEITEFSHSALQSKALSLQQAQNDDDGIFL